MTAARRRVTDPTPEDISLQAARELTKGMAGIAMGLQAVASSVRENTAQRRAADHFWANANESIESGRRFFKKKGPWLLASIPPVAVAIGAIAPNAQEGLAHALATLAGG